MHACNNTPPINIKSTAAYQADYWAIALFWNSHPLYYLLLTTLTDKDKWMGLERMRWAKYFKVPMTEKFPEGFPPKTLAIQRALCAISQKFPEQLPGVIEAVYRSFWVEENNRIGDVEGFAPVFETVLGKEATQEVLSAVSFSIIALILLLGFLF